MKKLMVLIMVMTVLLVPSNAFASGNGNGTGGGKNEALRVESASIEDGGVLASDGSITLVFSKNVVNSKVAEDNRALFQVIDGNQAEVAIEVVMADDQVEPDKKNDVVIQFPQGLADGTYTLTAKKGITSKSGDVMEKDYTLTFQAGGAQAAEPAPAQTTEQADNQTTEQAADQTTEQTAGQTTKQAADQTAEQAAGQTTEAGANQTPKTAAAAESEGTNMMPMVIIIVVILAAAGGFVLLRKKK